MSNVIQLQLRPKPEGSRTALASCFAQHRRGEDDVFWLKENAEFLNVHQSVASSFSTDELAPYEEFYATVENRLRFFPQYYRFLLSITLDLEELGLGRKQGDGLGERLCSWVKARGLPDAELSDLQRAEAQRLLARRGQADARLDDDLRARLQHFISRKETFSLPNKKAAYELTHIVFYLSQYGHCDPELCQAAIQSLMFTGTLAFLDQNADLLAEVCIALGYARVTVPTVWKCWLEEHAQGFLIAPNSPVGQQDDYHEYLMCNWFLMTTSQEAFSKRHEAGALSFIRPPKQPSVLRVLSEYLYEKRGNHGLAWGKLKRDIEASLDAPSFALIANAERAMPDFEEFFAGFARAGV